MKTAASIIRNNFIIIATCALGIALLACSSESGHHEGIIRDENPSLAIPAYANIIGWCALALSFLLPVISIIVRFVKRNKYVERVLLIALIVSFALWVGSDTSFTKYRVENHAMSVLGNAGPGFGEITLRTFEDIFSVVDGDDTPVYIGKTDCPECTAFEEKIAPLLEANHFAISTYFTDSDRDGPCHKDSCDVKTPRAYYQND